MSFSAGLLDVGTVFPADNASIRSAVYVTCNNLDGYRATTAAELSTDPVTVLLAPECPFVGSIGSRAFSLSGHLGAQNSLASFAKDPRVVDASDSKTKIERKQVNGKFVYRVTLSKGQPLDAFNTHRAQFLAGGVDQRLMHGKDYWVGFAFKTPSQAIGGTGIIYAHSTANTGDSGIYWFLDGQTLRLAQWYNAVADGPRTEAKDPVSQANDHLDVWSSALPLASWIVCVMKVRCSWQNEDSPYLEAWTKIGQGPITRVADNTHRNAWNTPTSGQYSMCRFGPYWFAAVSGDYSGTSDPWLGAPAGTDLTLDLGALVAAPAVWKNSHIEVFDWLLSRTPS